MLPPRDAHEVASPFIRKESNSSITGTYIVDIATVKPSPDVQLSSINGIIDTTLYFKGGLPRQIGVGVTTTNGHIRLALPEQQHAQRLDIRVRTVNGRIHLLLPRTYQGLLTSSTTSGRTIFSDSLIDNSQLVETDGRKVVYRIQPEKADEKICEDGKLLLEDSCIIFDVNANILVEYYGENFSWEHFLDSNVTQHGCPCVIA